MSVQSKVLTSLGARTRRSQKQQVNGEKQLFSPGRICAKKEPRRNGIHKQQHFQQQSQVFDLLAVVVVHPATPDRPAHLHPGAGPEQPDRGPTPGRSRLRRRSHPTSAGTGNQARPTRPPKIRKTWLSPTVRLRPGRTGAKLLQDDWQDSALSR